MCTSPQNLSNLNDGSHTFSVSAIDAGNIDESPDNYTWTVDTIGPNARITDGPPNPSDSRSATFTFTGAEADGSYECKIDGAGSTGTFSAFTSGRARASRWTPTGLTPSTYGPSHALGNFGTPDSYTWTVDTTTTG